MVTAAVVFTVGIDLKRSGHICSIQIDVCVCFLPIYSGYQDRWIYQPGSHRRKVTQGFSSTFLLRCMPLFFSSTVRSHLRTND